MTAFTGSYDGAAGFIRRTKGKIYTFAETDAMLEEKLKPNCNESLTFL